MTDVTLLLNQLGIANRSDTRSQTGTTQSANGQQFGDLLKQTTVTEPSLTESRNTSKFLAQSEKQSATSRQSNSKEPSASEPKDPAVARSSNSRTDDADSRQTASETNGTKQAQKTENKADANNQSKLSKTQSDEQNDTSVDDGLSTPSTDTAATSRDENITNNPLVPLSALTIPVSNILIVTNPVPENATVAEQPAATSITQLASPLADGLGDKALAVNPDDHILQDDTVQTKPNSSILNSESEAFAKSLITPQNPMLTAGQAVDTAAASATTANNPKLIATDDAAKPVLADVTKDYSQANQLVAANTETQAKDPIESHAKPEGIEGIGQKDKDTVAANTAPITSAQAPIQLQNLEIAKQVAQPQPQTDAQAGALAQQVTFAIRKGATDGSSQMHIKLNPIELGGIDIRMEVDADHHVRAILTIEKPETYDLLHKDAQHLQKLLGESGLKLADANAIQYEQRSASSLASNSGNSTQDWLASGWFGGQQGQAGRQPQNDSGFARATNQFGDVDDAAHNPINLVSYNHGLSDGRINIRV